MALDPNIYMQGKSNPNYLMAKMLEAQGMPPGASQSAMGPMANAQSNIEGAMAAQGEVLPELYGSKMDLQLSKPGSMGGAVAGGLAMALANAWNTKVKKSEIELERKLRDIDDKKKMDMFKAELKERSAAELATKEALQAQREGSEEYQLDIEGKRLRNQSYAQNMERRAAGPGPGRPSSTGAAAVTSDLNQLDAFLLQNGYTQDELDVLTTKQKQAKVGQVAGRQEKIETEEDIVKELSRLDPTKETLNPYIKERREQLENKLARIRSGAPAETGRGRAFNLLLKGSSGAPETLPQTAPAGTPQTLPQRTDSTGNPTLTTDDIIKIINATQNQNGAQPKIKFNPNAGF